MNKRTPLISLVVLSLLLVVLSACTAPAAPPDRDVEISHAAALSAQDALMGGIVMGEVMLSESEFSSYVTKALEANSGPNQPVDSVMVWIEPDAMHFRVTLKDGVSMMGNTLDLVGNLMVSDGHLMVESPVGRRRRHGRWWSPARSRQCADQRCPGPEYHAPGQRKCCAGLWLDFDQHELS